MRYANLIALAALVAVAPAAAAQGGRTAAIVLELPSSTRALALGGAYVAAGADDAALFYNASQLATIEGRAASMSLQPYIEGSTLGAISGAFRLGPGTVGIGVQVLSYGSTDEYVCDETTQCERGELTGRTVSANEHRCLHRVRSDMADGATRRDGEIRAAVARRCERWRTGVRRWRGHRRVARRDDRSEPPEPGSRPQDRRVECATSALSPRWRRPFRGAESDPSTCSVRSRSHSIAKATCCRSAAPR